MVSHLSWKIRNQEEEEKRANHYNLIMLIGNFHLPNEAKVMLAPKNGVTNISPPTHLPNRGTNIQPKPISNSPVVIKVVSHGSTNGKQNISGTVCDTIMSFFSTASGTNKFHVPQVNLWC